MKAAWNMRWDRAQAAKHRLGIKGPVDIVLADFTDDSFMYTWFSGDHPVIFAARDLHPEFASFCLWHELKHVEQVEREYGGDGLAFLHDYHAAGESLGLEVGPDGFVETNSEDELLWYAMLPWECDANLCGWENRMTLLTRRGRGEHQAGPQGSWWYFRDLGLDIDAIKMVAAEYRG